MTTDIYDISITASKHTLKFLKSRLSYFQTRNRHRVKSVELMREHVQHHDRLERLDQDTRFKAEIDDISHDMEERFKPFRFWAILFGFSIFFLAFLIESAGYKVPSSIKALNEFDMPDILIAFISVITIFLAWKLLLHAKEYIKAQRNYIQERNVIAKKIYNSQPNDLRIFEITNPTIINILSIFHLKGVLKNGNLSKALTFLMIHLLVSFSVVYFLTGNAITGGVVAIIEPVINFFVFLFLDANWRDNISKKQDKRGT